jgi:methionyl-tRNA formyltransferase
MAALRIIFMGTAELSCVSLEKLARDENFSVTAAVTQPDKPRGRELKPQPSPVKSLAQKLILPVLQPAKARNEKFISELRGLKPDMIIVVAYGQILPQAILDLPKFGCLNVHTSLLPEYRGASPIQSAILNGETETGVTIMKMDAGLDTGDILAQTRMPILPEDNSQTLHDRLAQLGAELLVETIPNYVAGKISPKPQPAEGMSYTAKIKKEDGKIDWNEPSEKILNRLRAFTPWPGVFTFLDGKLVKIWKANFVEEMWNKETPLVSLGMKPGTILWVDKNGIIVTCGKDYLLIKELQREGGRRLSAQEFLAGNPLKAGEKFSTR